MGMYDCDLRLCCTLGCTYAVPEDLAVGSMGEPRYMSVCGVTMDNIHLLESKLMGDIMRNNIYPFQGSVAAGQLLLDSLSAFVGSVSQQRAFMSQYKRHIQRMAAGVSQIERCNHSLATQDHNNSALTVKLNEICASLQLHAKYEQTLKNPSFKPEGEYQRSLKPAQVLSTKRLHLSDGLRGMHVIKEQRAHFATQRALLRRGGRLH